MGTIQKLEKAIKIAGHTWDSQDKVTCGNLIVTHNGTTVYIYVVTRMFTTYGKRVWAVLCLEDGELYYDKEKPVNTTHTSPKEITSLFNSVEIDVIKNY